MNRITIALLGFATTAGLTAPVSAAALLLDYGPFANGAETLALTNSAAHSAGFLAPTDTAWNTLTTAGVGNNGGDLASGSVVYSNGVAATGVSIDSGRDPTTVDYPGLILNTTVAPNSALANGSQAVFNNTGIYSGPNKDLSFGTSTIMVGFAVRGLDPGTYHIFVAGRNLNSASAYPMEVYGAALPSGTTTWDYTNATPLDTYTNPAVADFTSVWTEGVTYGRIVVTTTAGNPDLFVGVRGAAESGDFARGFITTAQVLSESMVPEPASLSLLGLGALALMRRRRL